MISGAADERIALLIETDANLTGVRNARAEVKGLGTDTAQATRQMTTAQAAAIQSTNQAAAANGKLAVSQAEMKEALAATGGDLAAAAQLLAKKASATNTTVIANEQLVASEQAVASATETSARAMGLAQIAALKEDAARTAALNATGKIPPSARTAANAMGILSQAALTGNGSMAGMAAAAGGLSASIAAMSTSAKVAASAAGIGALITVGVVLADVYKRAKEEVGATQSQLDHIGNLSLTQIDGQLEQARQRADAATARAASLATGDIRDLIPTTEGARAEKYAEQQRSAYEALVKKAAEFRQQEAIRSTESQYANRLAIAGSERDLALLTEVNAKRRDSSQLALEQIDNERKAADDSVRASFRRLDANGHLIALSGEETAQLRQQLDLNARIAHEKGVAARDAFADALQLADIQRRGDSLTGSGGNDVASRFQARLDQIEFEKRKEIEKNQDAVGATQNAEQKKRALYRETASVAAANAKSIVDVLLSSGNKQVQAVGHAADAVRRILIGAQAAHAAVEAAIEGGKAIGALARGDFRGAALHGAAALELGKAAALGGQEALSGGGGGGGGSSGGASDSTTFTPRETGGAGGAQTIVIQTVNPFSREVIDATAYELGRAGILKRPIRIPPTTGFAGAA